LTRSPLGSLIEPPPSPPPAPIGGYKSDTRLEFGTIRVTTNVEGAIYIDEKYRSPVKKGFDYEYLYISEGKHEVKLLGYDKRIYPKIIDVKNGRIASVILPPSQPINSIAMGSILIESSEISGKVYINDELIGDIKNGESKTFSGIPVGKYTIRIMGDKMIASKKVTVKKDKIVAETLTPTPPFNLKIITN
jgi:hypothetical protein